MDNNSFSLTKNEQEIMDLLWSQDKALSRSEIIELSTERSWKKSSIHILLNSLLEKGAIKVEGFVKTGKNYGRTYSASVTQEEYQIMQFKQGANYLKSKSSAITGLVSALVQNEDIDNDTLDRLEAILQTRRSEKK
ncbi:MAG: BlaI/MecI/CopY family transcriptional regulator [Sedimentibacter saalensis]|jgi:predicted transcriptional regulator|uniref:BlaI/MecI/CopY family transcriptional regulator n=1 Tax=Sedimentibacter saalensis TaxID=130788 RepID=UPI002B2107BE|nr:BlaI/MecI/CopY family transcriptional regulator [Sedimentibacter saalensis]MEA5095294.1 BlaI/MecI/CopY family transcriptional regulator [Sedimentibacter saalensis]